MDAIKCRVKLTRIQQIHWTNWSDVHQKMYAAALFANTKTKILKFVKTCDDNNEKKHTHDELV